MSKKKRWHETKNTYIWIFSVGRGLSVAIRLGNGELILYDYGQSEEFKPKEFIREHILPHVNKSERMIGQTVISHPHADHINGIAKDNSSGEELDIIESQYWTCPHDKDPKTEKESDFSQYAIEERFDFSRLTNRESEEYLTPLYKQIYERRSLPLQTIPSREDDADIYDLEYGVFYMRPPDVAKIYPKDNQKYSNGCSLCLYVQHKKRNFLITGDITPEVFAKILTNDPTTEIRYTKFNPKENQEIDRLKSNQEYGLGKLIKNRLDFFVVPHHGLESCFCEDIYKYIDGGRVGLHLISEKMHTSNTDGKIDKRYCDEKFTIGKYIAFANGPKSQKQVNTAKGEHMLIVLHNSKPHTDIFVSSEPLDLMTKEFD